MMAAYRGHTLRPETKAPISWRYLMKQAYIALVAATEAATNGLRARPPPA